MSRWYPLCGLADLPSRHVFETDLLGQELAIWRSRNGNVNVWANRCPHRGMRLTVGTNLGDSLRCAYHGYRFADATGLCQRVPAHPDRTPPRGLCVRVFPVREQLGLVWTHLASDRAPPVPSLPELPADMSAVALYPVAVRATTTAVATGLSQHGFEPRDEFVFESGAVVLCLQPVDAGCTVIHGRLLEPLDAAATLAAQRQFAERLQRLCALIEAA